jgi:hypothetical protein
MIYVNDVKPLSTTITAVLTGVVKAKTTSQDKKC